MPLDGEGAVSSVSLVLWPFMNIPRVQKMTLMSCCLAMSSICTALSSKAATHRTQLPRLRHAAALAHMHASGASHDDL